MYNKILNFFESTFCVENIFLREHYKFWFIGWFVNIVEYIIIIKVLEWQGTQYSFIMLLIISFLILLPFVVELCVKEYKIFKKVIGFSGECKLDWLNIFSNEATYSMYLDAKIKGMKQYLIKEGMYTETKIEKLINIAYKELNEKYPEKNILEKFLSNFGPYISIVITAYLANNAITNLDNIVTITCVFIVCGFFIYFIYDGIKNMRFTTVDKRKNLLDFIEVLENIRLEL